MVTTWEGHWDKLGRGETYYTLPLIKDGIASGPWPAEAATLFIKRNENDQVEKTWIGVSKNIKKTKSSKGKEIIRFQVANLQEVECPNELKDQSSGWHLNKTNISIPVPGKPAVKAEDPLRPSFFSEMESCDWPAFERHCFHLLRLIGIHDIHAIPHDDSRGKADGIFHFHTLTVIYDATLDQDFRDSKATQIENYLNQLKKEKIKIGQQNHSIKNTLRQVWIITRGESTRLIETEDGIKVKEIPFRKLVEVYDRRLKEELGTDELQTMLVEL